jgi:hypothetical protein
MRRLFTCVMAGVAILAGLATCVVYYEFLRYQGGVDRTVAALPTDERAISSSVVNVLEKLDGHMIPELATRGLLLELCPEPVSQGRWHLRHGLWGALLPLRLSRRDLTSLYAHYMVFEGGTGLNYGARRYYSKGPADLSPEEAVALVTISRAPVRYSPERHHDEYEVMYQRLLAKYRAAG